MEAVLAEELPDGPGWQYEPKWDGFRCLARRDGAEVELISKSGKPLARYFPDMVESIAALPARRFLLDGELVIPRGDALSFEALQLRLHPAASRVRKLAAEHPAQYLLFDLLDLDGRSLVEQAQSKRRETLERFVAENSAPGILLSPATTNRDTALAWLERSGGALDGVVAKQLDLPYRPGERATVQVKVTILDPDPALKPEMSAKVTFLDPGAAAGFASAGEGRSSGGKVLSVPGNAVIHRDGKSLVFSVVDGRATLVEVETGSGSEGRVVVKRGLAGTERVVLDPPSGLASGDRVRSRG